MISTNHREHNTRENNNNKKKRPNPTASRVQCTYVCELANELEQHRPFVRATTPHRNVRNKTHSFERINNLTIKQFFITKRYIGRLNAMTTMTTAMVNSANVKSHSKSRRESERGKEKSLNGMKIPHQEILCQERFPS